jgi:hypothetical protein
MLKLGPEIYVLQCALYVLRNVNLGIFKDLYKKIKMFQKYTELCLPACCKHCKWRRGGVEGL